MMESCLNNNDDRREQVEVDDLKRDLSSEFSTLPDRQHSSIEEREHLRVYLRIRPFSSAESNNGESQDCVTIEPPDTALLKPPSLSFSARLSTDKSLPHTGQRFQFSQVYGPETTQRELFQGTVKDLVKDVLEGGNSLVFTYGVTNAGKTFTFLGPDVDAGILPRSLDIIFSSIDEQVFTGMSIKPHRCREFTRLTREQQAEEVAFKRNFLRQPKENEKNNASQLNSTSKTLFEGSSVLGTTVVVEEDKIHLAVEAHTKFSVWVSFCEIYNENIHDLLEVMPSGAPRRTALRLSQDVKGNSFVKDLRWVQVNSAEEAYKVMKLGKKNQSFSSTRLNQLSSRSHSIFSIRILRIEDVGSLRVHGVSELCLCDLAGSERCAKTQNKGERLKEAGNINTSLLILGKCINALRHNQQAKLRQHVPFRESKLTHYLQSFFCGRGKACMIVNINQCASMYDETLSVLKFSAVAQKVVVVSTRPPPILPKRSASEVSFIINNAERKALRGNRRSSLIGWDTSLEDVQEDEYDEYDEEEQSLMESTMDQTGSEEDNDESDDKIVIGKKMQQRQVALLGQLQVQLKKERAESLLMEARVREEISREFSELFSEMQKDYNDRLAREREILEERAETRLKIFKNLIDKMAPDGPSHDAQAMDTSLGSYSSELSGIKKCLCSGRAGAQVVRGDAGEELERKVLELNEHQQKAHEQMAHKHNGDAGGVEDEEKRRLLFQLQEKLSEISRLEKQVGDLQKEAELGSQSCSLLVEEGSSRETGRLQEALAACEKEKRGKEDALAALEYQTMGREEALASLEEERKAKEEALATLRELERSKEEVLSSLKEEREGNNKANAALEAERRANAIAIHSEEKKSRMDIVAALCQEKRGKQDAESALEVERKEISRLVEEREKRQQEGDALQQEVRELTARLEATEHQRSEQKPGLKIFKNLIDKMAPDGPSHDAQAMDTSLGSYSSELSGIKKCLCSGRAGAQVVRGDAGEELERKVLELNEHQQKAHEQMAHKHNGDAGGVEDEEKRRLLFQLQEKLSEISRLEKQVGDLQKEAELGSQSCSLLVEEGSSRETGRLQEALAACEKEKRGKEDALAALEYQTMGREEALASLEEERKAKEEALATLRELERSKEEVLSSLKEEREGNNKANAALEAERRANAIAIHSEEKKSRMDIVAALCQEKRGKQDAESALEVERKEISRLVEEREKRQQEGDALQQEVRELTARLEATEHQVTSQTERAEQVLFHLQAAQEQQDQHGEEIQDKTSQIHTLTQELQSLKQQLQTSAASDGVHDQLREEVSELRKNLAEEKEKNKSKLREMLELEQELGQAKEQLAHKQQISDQQLEQFTEKQNQQEAALTHQVEELRKKLQEQEEMSQQTLDDLRSMLQCQEHEHLAKLEEQVEELNEKLREQDVISQQLMDELQQKLSEQKEDDLEQTLSQQEEAAQLLKAQLEEAKLEGLNNRSSSAAEEDLKRLNSELQTKIASLKSKVFNMEEAQLASSEMEKMLKVNHKRTEEKLAEAAKVSAEREAELQKQLLGKEAKVTSLQKSLQEQQEQREEESQAVQEARRREVERRRELLAVAHEAIAQKDAELEKKAEDINRLKQNAEQDSDKVKSLGLDLQRKEDDTSDLREKLADYKKQIQQVQKEISAMREEERVLRQKLTDVEKVKKQLQSDITNRDRTIQHLKVEQSSDTKSDPTLYQKACEDLGTKERVMEDMRLALTEQEETQDQMETVLEEKLNLIQEMSSEVEKLKGMLLLQDRRGNDAHRPADSPSHDLTAAKQEAAQAQERLKLCAEKHQGERKKWLEEKMFLIGQAKEAEDKRNQEMRKFADDRERYTRQQSHVESLSSQLAEKEQHMDHWRKERDTLVAALGVQLQKLLSSQAEKDKLIQQLRQNTPQPPPPEISDGGVCVAELQAALSDRESEIQRLKEELEASNAKQENTQTKSNESPATSVGKPQSETINRKSVGRRDARASVSSQGSAGYPSVLDSSEISTENGRMSRFPRPELEISFSPLQPNRMALRRQGEENSVTVKITRSARKRKSGEMEKTHMFRRSKRGTTHKRRE
ncbi:kinesin-like protein KIF20B [Cottoperca gobio]|uniref:Kinesin-like protein KIF20B n=1 Tax=Cottoperca gobio TaxID=56716 RepID=A0A6J2R5U4_COTGO|nr:kinesin-like protein KIF20B [Cottoperca gobio]